MRKVGLVVLAGLATMAFTGAPASLGSVTATKCDGTLDSGAYKKLVVPAGATCDGTGAKIRVRHGVKVHKGATFILGTEGMDGTTGRIRGGVRANSPASLQLHFANVKGGVRLRGGNGYFSTVEDNVIGGGARVTGYSGTWLGFIRNEVHGSVFLSDNKLEDPDANEYVTNTIFGDLVCRRNSPHPQIGDSSGEQNVVNGEKVGQCAGL